MDIRYENYGPYRLQVDYKENGVEVIAFPVMNYARETTLGFEVSVDLKDIVSDEFINECSGKGLNVTYNYIALANTDGNSKKTYPANMEEIVIDAFKHRLPYTVGYRK
jgi:hypothetical protein